MFRRSAFVTVPALALVLVMAVASRAADDPLKIIPRDALGWGVINHLADGDAKIQKLAGIVGAPQMSLLDLAKDKMGLKNGLDTKGAFGVIAMPPNDKDDEHTSPTFVLFVAVTDYKAFLGNFEPEKKDEKITEVQVAGQTAAMAERGGYAVFAKTDDRKALERVLASKESIADEAKSLDAWLGDNDVNLVATKTGVKLFAAKGKVALKQFGETLAAMGQGDAAKSGLQVYASLLDAAEKNVSLGALGLLVDKAGTVRLVTRAKIIEGGKLAAALADVKPASGDQLAGLPGGSFVFAGGVTLSESLIGPIMGMSIKMMKSSPEIYGINAEQADKLGKASVENFKSMHAASVVMKTGRRDEPLYSNMYGSFSVDNAEQFLAGYEKQIAAMKEILKDAKEGMFKAPSAKEIEIGGKPALEVEITFPVPKMAGNPMADKMMQAMFGPDKKSTAYLVKGDEKTIYFSLGVSQEKLLQGIAMGKEQKKSLAADADVAATIALLPAGAHAVALISPRGYIDLIQRLMGTMMGENAPGLKIPPFPKCPPAGVAFKAAPGEISAEFVIPAGLMKAVGEYIGTVRQGMFGAPQPQTP